MRPRSLEEFVGQQHILAPGKLLRRAIEADRLPSVILSGPPGTGKTTLAQIIAEMTQAKFERLSGVESNVAEMRKVVPRRLIASALPARRQSSSWMRFITSTKCNRTSSCPTWRAETCG
jgi:putative ATPase